MTILSGQETITDTATLIYKADADGARILIHNDAAGGGTVVYLGAADVTAITGLHLSGNEAAPQIVLGAYDAIYGITASGTAPVSCLIIN
jgi:hypothetical protein